MVCDVRVRCTSPCSVPTVVYSMYGSEDVQHIGRHCSMDRMMGKNRIAACKKSHSSALCMKRILGIGGQTAKKAHRGRRSYLLLVQIKLQNNKYVEW